MDDNSLMKSFENVQEKLEKCCLGVEQLRQDAAAAESLLSVKANKRMEIEKRIETDTLNLKVEMETSRTLLETRLKLNRHELEQSLQTDKLVEVREELKLLRLQRRELIIELTKIKDEVKSLEEADSSNVKESSDDEEDKKEVDQLKKMLQYNLAQLKEEQDQLKDIILSGQQYVNNLQTDRTMMERLVKEAGQEHRRLKEDALSKEIKTHMLAIKALQLPSKSAGDVAEKSKAPEAAETSDELELILAEKFCQLESLQTMLEQTLDMNRKLELL